MPVKALVFVATLAAMMAPAFAQTDQIQITSPWARATPGGATTAAAYMTIMSPTADRLVAVSTPIAKKAELHTMTMTGTVMKMRQIAAIDLPAGLPVTLKPVGIHIMLTGLAQPLKQGQSFPLTLTFAKGGTHEVTVAVEKVGAMGPAGAPGGAMPMQH
jgi:copper(I)-binding protein